MAKGYEYQHAFRLRGKLVGHLLPGFIFMLWGAEWIFYYLRSRARKHVRNEPASFFCRAELVLKLLVPCIGITSEMASGHWSPMFYQELGELVQGGDNVYTNMNNYFHATMHAGFLLSGIVDLLETKWRLLPRGSGVAVLSLAFAMEGLLFGYHAQMHQKVMKNEVESLAHRLLLIPIYVTSIALLIEFVVGLVLKLCPSLRGSDAQEHKGTKALLEWLLVCRAMGNFLQGSWMFQMPFMPEDMFATSMASMMATTIYFGWQVLGTSMVWIGSVVFYEFLCIRKTKWERRSLKYSPMQMDEMEEARERKTQILE